MELTDEEARQAAAGWPQQPQAEPDYSGDGPVDVLIEGQKDLFRQQLQIMGALGIEPPELLALSAHFHTPLLDFLGCRPTEGPPIAMTRII